MTDTEIIKALECCTTKGAKCSDCPAFKKVDRSYCKKYFRGAIDLIKRQKAEIERLNNISAMSITNGGKGMTKDCIHRDVCLEFYTEGALKNRCKDCEKFKDKSRIIELPCKVGDIVWAKGVFTENIYSYKVDNVGLCHAVYHNPKGLNNEIDFKEDNIGKTVFLTKEEAEAKLKELNENENT